MLDPFGGSGTTGAVAQELGRNAVLLEISPEYVGLMRERMLDVTGLLASQCASLQSVAERKWIMLTGGGMTPPDISMIVE